MATPATTGTTTQTAAATVRPQSQQVVVVSRQHQLNGVLETMLGAGEYDVVLIESTDRAYSHIKRMHPNLVIVCLDVEDLDGFQVLSMLKLDPDTRAIPVLTCTPPDEEDEMEDDELEPQEILFGEPSVAFMN